MKANKIWGALLATTFGLAAVMAPMTADAQKKKKAEAVVAPTGPAQIPRPIQVFPEAKKLTWGMSLKELGKAIDSLLDEDYKPVYQKTSPGIQMKTLDAQVVEEKSQFRRSRIDFGTLPVALDATPLREEYSYNNKESMLSLVRKGETRHFFMIQDRLWKIIHEVPLGPKSPYGKDFTEAAVKLSTLYGVPGRVIPANPDKQIYINVVDWQDDTVIVRLKERSESLAAIVYIHRATHDNIDTLRANKPVVEEDIPAEIRALARDASPPPGPPEPKKDEAKPKK